VVGPNGAGKTNLLEAVHVATQGFSPRTRLDARLVRIGASAARAAAAGERGGASFETSVTVRRARKEVQLDGVVVPLDRLRAALPVLVFTPDRLAVAKGAPIVRRTYLDRMIGRVRPGSAGVPGEYAAALAQRNAALRRVRSGLGAVDSVAPWTAAVATIGSRLDGCRAAVVAELAPRFALIADRLALPDAELCYEPTGMTAEDLEARIGRDLDRGTTGLGPHLADVAITVGGHDLRGYGSQGQQRLGVLALVLAEAAVVVEARGEPPLLLLDDVLSELDPGRRERLLAELPPDAQTLITATTADVLPEQLRAADALVVVEPGTARLGAAA
jgi:DNA replication and repair protein RecF